ncbi:MAG TPA: hypothetical protein DIC35_02955 [Candidatus Moranbacteria bacterium]|nr:hypothetical protein [Candidatus Moranbacteria bacterium]
MADEKKDQHEELGTIMRTRTAEQYQLMQETVRKGICPFCQPEGWKNPPIREGKYWILKFNDFPYKHHRHHLVLVFRKHGNENDVMPISPEAWAEFGEMFQWTITEFGMRGGGLAMRFGHPDFNASTIRHLHAHIQEPDLTGPAKATFAKDRGPEEEARRVARLASFEDQQGGNVK